MRAIHAGLVVGMLAAGVTARAQSVTPLFLGGLQPGVTPVHAIAVDTNRGQVLVGGRFSYLSGAPAAGLGILNMDGSVSTVYVSPPPPTGTILAAAFDAPRGRYFFAGSISNPAADRAYLGVAYVTQGVGRVEYWAGTEPGGHIRAMAQHGNHLWVGGAFTSFAGVARQNLAQLSALTGEPTDFNLPASSTVTVFSVLGDDTLLVGGAFTNIGTEPRQGLARLHPSTGALDTNYAGRFQGGPVYAIAPARSNVYVGGLFTSVANQACGRIAKLDALTGARDLTATGGAVGVGAIYTIVPAGNDHLLVGGSFLNYSGNGQRYLALVGTNLDPIAAFTAGVNGIVHAAAALSSTSALVSGRFTQYQDHPALGLVEILSESWRRHPIFSGSVGGPGEVYALAELPDGTVAVGGTFYDIGGEPTRNLARLYPNGTLCQAFVTNGPNGRVYALAPAVHGADTQRVFYAGGAFTSVGDRAVGRLTRYEFTAVAGQYVLTTSVLPHCDGDVRALATSTSHLYAGGSFESVAGITNHEHMMGCVHGSLAPDPAFASQPGSVLVAVLVDTNLFLGGSIYNEEAMWFDGFVRKVSAADGAPTAGFNAPTPNAPVGTLWLSDTSLYAGGDFTIIGPYSANYLARFHTGTGARDATYAMHADASVYALAGTTQSLYAGGYFTSFNTTSRLRVARFDAASGQLQSGYSNIFDGQVNALLSQGSRLWAGGQFSAAGGQPAASLALLGWPQLAYLRQTPAGFELAIAGAPGQTGTVEQAADLNAQDWSAHGSYALGPDENQVVAVVTNPAANRFYRARGE
ncbi:MAG TPA: delta-60 repeat domain-containing protein [Kiritimatiellia bacterium]|nr:delta-60 repeat domain-containing protein [Kiritimatiellia bacterium]HRZ12826.1 delta-60 repeat domain-containing protein [Kiritimatiellia bacterium]HSA18222.1 delta-60 repeat domain-containing protein [Kiritimatiellia bacterium]